GAARAGEEEGHHLLAPNERVLQPDAVPELVRDRPGARYVQTDRARDVLILGWSPRPWPAVETGHSPARESSSARVARGTPGPTAPTASTTRAAAIHQVRLRAMVRAGSPFPSPTNHWRSPQAPIAGKRCPMNEKMAASGTGLRSALADKMMLATIAGSSTSANRRERRSGPLPNS